MMETISIFVLCLACFLFGVSYGQLKATNDWQKIIDSYKETIELYKGALNLK
jgi:hypothetical protein